MASRVAQQDAKRQLSKGKKKSGKTTTLIVTHGFPLVSHKTIYMHFQNKEPQHSTVGKHYASVVIYSRFIDGVVNDPNVFCILQILRLIYTVPTIISLQEN